MAHADVELAKRIVGGDAEAARELGEIRGKLIAAVIHRGAKPEVAEDIVSEVIVSCYAKDGLLSKYSGKGALVGFLRRVATNNFISFVRKVDTRDTIRDSDIGTEESGSYIENLVSSEEMLPDVTVDILRDAILEAYANVDPISLVMIQMKKKYGVTQTRVGEAFGIHPGTVTRRIQDVSVELKELVQAKLQEIEPELTLTWEDFVELCKQSNELFIEDDEDENL